VRVWLALSRVRASSVVVDDEVALEAFTLHAAVPD
jgi:hypothetical protein